MTQRREAYVPKARILESIRLSVFVTSGSLKISHIIGRGSHGLVLSTSLHFFSLLKGYRVRKKEVKKRTCMARVPW